MIHIDFTMFIDRPGVMARVDKKRRRVLGKTGAYARTSMQRSIRPAGKKRKSSEPGKPPRSRQGGLRENIYFGLDEVTESVVIAPLRFQSQPKLIGAASVPELLEGGGGEMSERKDGTVSISEYAPRPFVAPQQQPAEQKLAQEIESTPL
jgi:hypothetical protein